MGPLTGAPDLTLIAELSDEIERHPPAVCAKTLLVHHYLSIGWIGAAADLVKELQRDASHDTEIVRLAEVVKQSAETRVAKKSKANTAVTSSKPGEKAARRTPAFRKMASELVDGHQSLREKAKDLFGNLLPLQAEQRKLGLPTSGVSVSLKAFIEGRNVPKVSAGPPSKVHAVMRAILSIPEKAVDLVILDFENVILWLRGIFMLNAPNGASEDEIREILVKRTRAIQKGLPESLKPHCELGFMHTEHENLHHKYANDALGTMVLNRPLKEIPREDFYVTEDNYAWEISELTTAIRAGDGVMRNPLSKEMFTLKDIRGILRHPRGKALEALAIAQEEMSQGVRDDTITRMGKLAEIMLAEREQDQKKSRKAYDEFQAYIATLPEREQKTIEAYRCPAYDEYARKAYDDTIGQTLKDFHAGILCVHKAGDFLRQAAVHLRCNRGMAPRPSTQENSCVVMCAGNV
ncbi:hypothetical protein BU23DRAFT_523658 [Bimuria novae-zelandiae CBS 107.79]|uniref:Uncharacterized protein n=1 Tax=Bimuria novae-zelandiae CBS 107.79 TaxID=1447943 RepID=A0A6A5W136_9PLEO|nr:hypothetical protein BU23DRAFT_523658 [Bimuria novae-zelandiae CBS 107.79]